MAITQRNIFGDPLGPTDPNTGAAASSAASTASAEMSTQGASGGLGHSDTGQADLEAYKAAQQQYSAFDDDGAGGTTI